MNFTDGGTLVEYFTYNSFEFDAALSIGDPRTTTIVTVDLAALGARAALGSVDTWERAVLGDVLLDAFNASMSGTASIAPAPLFIACSVDELVWGRNSSLLEWINSALDANASVTLSLQHNSTSEQADRAFFGMRDRFYTGKGDSSNLGVASRWQRWTNLPWWGDASAQRIQGTDGHGFAPPIAEHSNLTVFVNEAFRSIQLRYRRHVKVFDLEGFRFDSEPSQFDNTCSPSNPTCSPYWLTCEFPFGLLSSASL